MSHVSFSLSDHLKALFWLLSWAWLKYIHLFPTNRAGEEKIKGGDSKANSDTD